MVGFEGHFIRMCWRSSVELHLHCESIFEYGLLLSFDDSSLILLNVEQMAGDSILSKSPLGCALALAKGNWKRERLMNETTQVFCWEFWASHSIYYCVGELLFNYTWMTCNVVDKPGKWYKDWERPAENPAINLCCDEIRWAEEFLTSFFFFFFFFLNKIGLEGC